MGSNVNESDLPNVDLRGMTLGDLKQVSELVCRCYQFLACTEGLGKEVEDDLVSTRGSESAILHQMEQCDFVVAQVRKDIVGIVSIHKNEIDKLYVLPSCHRKGIGRALFQEACRIIRKRCYTDILLCAFPSAIPFYEKMGMKRIEEKRIEIGSMAGMYQPVLQMSLLGAL